MSTAIDAAMPELERWVGRKRIVEDEIALSHVRRIAGMLDLDPDGFRNGQDLPPHWFPMFFTDAVRQSRIGPDGHPDKGVVLPPIPLPRRMGAGRRVRIMGRLKVGQPATKTAEVAAIVPKQGRTGPIVVLTMRHTIATGGRTVAVDEFDAIYREAVPAGEKSPVTPPTAAPTDATWSETVALSPTLVFRYSAITWNAHRIHYDADYARADEGYPTTVQNGGLTMQLIVDAALKHAPGELTGFSARLTRALYVGSTATLAGRAAEDGRMACWAADEDGHLCGELSLDFAR